MGRAADATGEVDVFTVGTPLSIRWEIVPFGRKDSFRSACTRNHNQICWTAVIETLGDYRVCRELFREEDPTSVRRETRVRVVVVIVVCNPSHLAVERDRVDLAAAVLAFVSIRRVSAEDEQLSVAAPLYAGRPKPESRELLPRRRISVRG